MVELEDITVCELRTTPTANQCGRNGAPRHHRMLHAAELPPAYLLLGTYGRPIAECHLTSASWVGDCRATSLPNSCWSIPGDRRAFGLPRRWRSTGRERKKRADAPRNNACGAYEAPSIYTLWAWQNTLACATLHQRLQHCTNVCNVAPTCVKRLQQRDYPRQTFATASSGPGCSGCCCCLMVLSHHTWCHISREHQGGTLT